MEAFSPDIQNALRTLVALPIPLLIAILFFPTFRDWIGERRHQLNRICESEGRLYAAPYWTTFGYGFMLFSFLSSLGILQYYFLFLFGDRAFWQALSWKWTWLASTYVIAFLLAASFARLENIMLFMDRQGLFVLRGGRVQCRVSLDDITRAQIQRPVRRSSTLRGTFKMLYSPLILLLRNGEVKEGWVSIFGMHSIGAGYGHPTASSRSGLSPSAAASFLSDLSRAVPLLDSPFALQARSPLRSILFLLILLFFGWFHGTILFIYWSQ